MFSNKTFQEYDKEKQGEWKAPFTFVQGADTQLGLIERYWEKKPEPKWDKEILLAKSAVRIINEMQPRPRFFVICGDMVDAYPGTQDRNAQEVDLKNILMGVHKDIPIVCVCGNHDVGDIPSRESIVSYRQSFGKDYFTFWVGGVKFIVLNSQYYMDHTQVPDLALEHERWLEEELSKNKDGAKHVIVFQHIPWFLKTADEDGDGYFNIAKTERIKWLDKLQNSGVSKVFCGHYHRNAGGWYNDMECVVTSAIGCQIGNDKSGFRVVEVKENDISHRYYNLEDYPDDKVLNINE